MRYNLPIIFIFFILPLFAAPLAYAQNSVVPDPVQYILSPENPGPNQLEVIQIQGVGQFLGNSTITWEENGTPITASDNKEFFSFTTGGVGQVTDIHVSINSPTQGFITHDIVFNPSVINLVWEADTYTPLLYAGKALYSAGSNLKVVAFPTVLIGGGLASANQLSFQWYRADTLDSAASGLGKNVYSFQGDQLQAEEDIAVDVYSGTTKVGRGEVTIPVSSPQILVYVQDPLRGELLGTALEGQAQLPQTETTLKAEPYFFASSGVQHSTLQYNWTLDSQDTSGPQSAEGLLTLRQTGSGGGSADLGISVQNTNTVQYAQSASTDLTLIFGTQSGSSLSNFFGL